MQDAAVESAIHFTREIYGPAVIIMQEKHQIIFASDLYFMHNPAIRQSIVCTSIDLIFVNVLC